MPDVTNIDKGGGGVNTRHGGAEEAQARLAAIVESSDYAIVGISLEGIVNSWNPGAERLFEYSAEEILGRHVSVLAPPERHEEVRAVIEATRRGERLEQLETVRVTKRGRRVDVSLAIYPICDPEGEVVGVSGIARDVTERKEAEVALRESEERHRRQSRDLALLHQVRTALAHELDPVTVYRTVVEVTAEAYGYTQVSAYHLKGDNLLLQHQVGYHHVIECIPISEGVSGRAARTKRPILLGDVRTDPDFLGAIEGITSEICVPLLDEGEVVGVFNVESTGGVSLTPDDLALMVALGEHVSVAVGRAQLHARVRESEEHFRSLVQYSSDVITLAGSDGTVRYVSPAIRRVLGYRPEERIGRSAFELVHPADAEGARGVLAKILRTPGVPLTHEVRMRHKDGSWRRIEAKVTNRLDEPSVAGIVLNWRDTTERRETEEALRKTEERYRILVEQIPAVTFVDEADGTGEPLYVSPQVEQMLGYAPEEWKAGRLWRERLHPDDRDRVLASDELFWAHGEPVDEEYRLQAKDGSMVWVREETVLVRGEDGEPLFVQGILSDVTERKVAEAAVRKSEASLAESQRIAHLGTWEWDVKTNEVWWSEETYRIYGFRLGGVEPSLERLLGVVHPEDRERLQQAIEDALHGRRPYDLEHRIVRTDGAVRWVHRRAEVVRGEGGEAVKMLGTVHDITDRKALEGRLQHQALHDDLTGLPNRHLFVDRLGQALRRTGRRDGRVAVLFTDLDEFKMVNDSFGHEVGDRLLVDVTGRLGSCLRPEDTLARFGGDEFVMLIEEPSGTEGAVRVAERVLEEFGKPFSVGGRQLHVGSSIGIALGNARTKSPEDLLRDADTAMYQAKESGTGYRVFDPAMYERVVGRLDLENDIRRALGADEFVVHYQPLVSLETGRTWGLEALVRWEHPERGMLLPEEFVPVAEEGGLVVPLGERVLFEACKQAATWQERLPASPPLRVSVNLSARQLRRPDFEDVIDRALRESGLHASCLSLDLTETVYITALEEDTEALDRLKATGVGVSIDDFGTGYSSLAYLKRLPAEVLKLDRSFVSGLGLEVEDTAIAQTIVDLAHIMGMEVIAEGVEIAEQAVLLREMGCDMGQGYYFSRPLLSEEVAEFLRSGPG